MTATPQETDRRLPTVLAAAVLTALCLTAAPVAAEVYIVTLKNGNTFLSKYKPVEAHYDSSKMLIMTDVGNTVALRKDDVEDVVSDSEHRGFGIVIDTSTIFIGYTANDAPTIEQLQEAANSGAFRQPVFAPAPVYNTQQFAEPNQGGGIPVSFVTRGLVPTSASPIQP